MHAIAFLVLAAAASAPAPAVDYSARLTGKRLVLEGAACAGWSFDSKERVTRYDESVCSPADEATFEARLRWVSRDTFLIIEKDLRTKKDCPPRTWFYKVEAVRGSRVSLKEVWTGWGAQPDSVEEYVIQAPGE